MFPPNKEKTLKSKLKRCLQFMKLLTIEPYVFAFQFVFTLIKVPTTQLNQDKFMPI